MVAVDPELEAVVDEDVVLEVVAAVLPPAAAVAALIAEVTSDERSIEPTFGETKLATESEPPALARICGRYHPIGDQVA